MVRLYLDSCIIVKLVSREPDSEFYDDLALGQTVVSSELALAEVRSALLAKERARRISRQTLHMGWRLFQHKVRGEEIRLLALNRQVVDRAAVMMDQCHPRVALRTLDAIHIATADLHGCEQMCSNDPRVREASDLIGLALSAVPNPSA
jgi:predicted nucleic acid-binding protein